LNAKILSDGSAFDHAASRFDGYTPLPIPLAGFRAIASQYYRVAILSRRVTSTQRDVFQIVVNVVNVVVTTAVHLGSFLDCNNDNAETRCHVVIVVTTTAL
jgi:hypothetical protein